MTAPSLRGRGGNSVTNQKLDFAPKIAISCPLPTIRVGVCLTLSTASERLLCLNLANSL